MKEFLLYIWQLPQNLVGLVVMTWVKVTERRKEYPTLFRYKTKAVIDFVDVFQTKRFPGGVSLGDYVFIQHHTILAHELGHHQQSLYLGPLYLLVIGIPSILHAWIYRLCGRKWDYYEFYTEKWAEKLKNTIVK